jgi:hypothetical protein
MTKNDILRKQMCSSGRCMAMWCGLNTVFGTCRGSKYQDCEEFKDLERELEVDAEAQKEGM